jgi:hypothetical protein
MYSAAVWYAGLVAPFISLLESVRIGTTLLRAQLQPPPRYAVVRCNETSCEIIFIDDREQVIVIGTVGCFANAQTVLQIIGFSQLPNMGNVFIPEGGQPPDWYDAQIGCA